MPVLLPLTIEILGSKDGTPVVLDRVIGGSVNLDEAKRIGQRLLSIVEAETPAIGYRILSRDHDVIYDWRVGQDDKASRNQTPR
jgi:hypothetical protein